MDQCFLPVIHVQLLYLFICSTEFSGNLLFFLTDRQSCVNQPQEIAKLETKVQMICLSSQFSVNIPVIAQL